MAALSILVAIHNFKEAELERYDYFGHPRSLFRASSVCVGFCFITAHLNVLPPQGAVTANRQAQAVPIARQLLAAAEPWMGPNNDVWMFITLNCEQNINVQNQSARIFCL